MTGPTSTLALLVTCSRDETRRNMAVQVMQNLAAEIPRAELQDSFVIFDNASTFKNHLAFAPAGSIIVESPDNVGYWSAIKWVLEKRSDFFQKKTFDFIYIIESDLVHHDLYRLQECEEFLYAHPSAGSVRTQEFSVRHRWRFDKRLKFLPFHISRSEIVLKNGITNKKAWFKQWSENPRLYLSNLHAKLPALNRLNVMDEIFSSFAEHGDASELMFFQKMVARYPHIGVMDGGLFHSIFDRTEKNQISGSYSNSTSLNKIGYQGTRVAKMIKIPDNLHITQVTV